MYLIIMSLHYVCTCMFVLFDNWDLLMFCVYMYICIYVYNAKQKQPGCKKVQGQSEATMVISDQKL